MVESTGPQTKGPVEDNGDAGNSIESPTPTLDDTQIIETDGKGEV